MLPDYRDFKTELAELLQQFMRQRVAAHSPFIGQIPKSRAFEGNRMAIHRSSGDTSSNDYKHLSVAHSVPVAEAENMTLMDVLRHLDEIAAKMAKEVSVLAFKRMDEELEAAGQVFDAKGEGMSGSTLLKVMEGIEMSFDADGRHRTLSLLIPPQKAAATTAALRALEEDPEIREKYNALIEKKREEWRVREASRRLVG